MDDQNNDARAALAAQQAAEPVGWAVMNGDKVAPPLIDRKGVADILKRAGETVRPLVFGDTHAPATPQAEPVALPHMMDEAHDWSDRIAKLRATTQPPKA